MHNQNYQNSVIKTILQFIEEIIKYDNGEISKQNSCLKFKYKINFLFILKKVKGIIPFDKIGIILNQIIHMIILKFKGIKAEENFYKQIISPISKYLKVFNFF